MMLVTFGLMSLALSSTLAQTGQFQSTGQTFPTQGYVNQGYSNQGYPNPAYTNPNSYSPAYPNNQNVYQQVPASNVNPYQNQAGFTNYLPQGTPFAAASSQAAANPPTAYQGVQNLLNSNPIFQQPIQELLNQYNNYKKSAESNNSQLNLTLQGIWEQLPHEARDAVQIVLNFFKTFDVNKIEETYNGLKNEAVKHKNNLLTKILNILETIFRAIRNGMSFLTMGFSERIYEFIHKLIFPHSSN